MLPIQQVTAQDDPPSPLKLHSSSPHVQHDSDFEDTDEGDDEGDDEENNEGESATDVNTST